ncbi:CPBP family intramembrane glutamic endopeptidase [Winogradskya humida]|uniref:CAAX amino protease n=1 Tax=Winogradskya humida TaxID=113566 RepID=A0ABQ3ZW05_9ACTN|nr:CPBP family intramembrane glutamic endopeptidase [Actinoplanes humidus]GIE22786.1 CAAX amino protease [Actinoplanes humidus]
MRTLLAAVTLIVLKLVFGDPGLILGLVAATAMLAAYYFILRRPAELSFPDAPREAATGFGIGFGLCALTVTFIAIFGMYHVDAFGSIGALFTALGSAIAAAVFEELLIRGIIFRLIESRLGTWWTVAVSSAIFGALHLLNDGATLTGVLAIGIEAGALLGLAYVATRRLWLAIGLHAAWNFTESGIFGIPVSGLDVKGLLEAHLTGPSAISGGTFGIEGSLITVLICLAATAALTRHARRHDRILPRHRRDYALHA